MEHAAESGIHVKIGISTRLGCIVKRSTVLSWVPTLAAALLAGCGSTGTITSHLYLISSESGTVEYSKPTSCYGPSYWFSAQIHPSVRLVLAEQYLGSGPVIFAGLEVGKDTEVWFDGPIEVLDPASADRFDFSPYTLRMFAGPSPRLSYSSVLFGPGKAPSSVQQKLIYDGGGNYHYHAELPMPMPRRQQLSVRVPAARVGDTRSEPMIVQFKQTTIAWRKACYDMR